MDINDMLREVLTPLGVEMETPWKDEPVENQLWQKEPEATMFQTSRDHYGVFYRLDLVNNIPELRVVMHDDLPLGFSLYRVIPTQKSALYNKFVGLESEGQSDEPQRHILFACGEILKNHFWKGWESENYGPKVIVTKLL